MPLLLKGLSTALRRDGGPEVHAGKRGQVGAGQGGPIPERFAGTTSKPKVPRERREDAPAAAEVRWPARRLARPEKKLPRLTVTAFTNLILTDRHYACRAPVLFSLILLSDSFDHINPAMTGAHFAAV